MPHAIILDGIETMAGTSSGGCLETLRGYCPTIESIEGQQNRTDPQQAVMDQAEVIAAKFETSGFTPSEICADTTELGTRIEAL